MYELKAKSERLGWGGFKTICSTAQAARGEEGDVLAREVLNKLAKFGLPIDRAYG